MTITTAFTIRFHRLPAALALVSAVPLLAACATSSAPVELSKGGYSCVDDSVECISRRQSLLRQLTADNSRSWMRDHPSPEAYASGVRLFAMKTKKREMNCDELDRGRREAEGAQTSLRSAANRLTPAQISRGAMFATEVSRELTNEMGKRCKRA